MPTAVAQTSSFTEVYSVIYDSDWVPRPESIMAHVRQSHPDSDLGFQVKSLHFFEMFPLRSAA